MDAQKIKALTNATKGSFDTFVGLRSFLIVGDLMFYLLSQVYKNIEENLLDPLLDPYIPKNFLVFKMNDKVELNIGKFLVNLLKTGILALLTFEIFKFTEPYFSRYLKNGGG